MIEGIHDDIAGFCQSQIIEDKHADDVAEMYTKILPWHLMIKYMEKYKCDELFRKDCASEYDPTVCMLKLQDGSYQVKGTDYGFNKNHMFEWFLCDCNLRRKVSPKRVCELIMHDFITCTENTDTTEVTDEGAHVPIMDQVGDPTKYAADMEQIWKDVNCKGLPEEPLNSDPILGFLHYCHTTGWENAQKGAF